MASVKFWILRKKPCFVLNNNNNNNNNNDDNDNNNNKTAWLHQCKIIDIKGGDVTKLKNKYINKK